MKEICYSVTTINRKSNYVSKLLETFFPSGPHIHLIVGQEDSSYLSPHKHNPLVHIHEVSAEFQKYKNLNVFNKQLNSVSRCLKLEGNFEGRIVFEDDIIFCRDWNQKFLSIISTLRTWHPDNRFGLSLFHWHRPKIVENQFDAYTPNMFLGTQAMYYSEGMVPDLLEFLDRNDKKLTSTFDLSIREFFINTKLPLYVATPSLVQHIGTHSTRSNEITMYMGHMTSPSFIP